MDSGRLEAFSDGVLAIIITIMVLEFRVPHATDLASLRPLVPVATSYVLSFVYVGIYWNNHHHMLHVTDRVNGGILWANMHLLFWLSLVPFATGWMGESDFAAVPVAVYGVVLLLAAIAFWILDLTLIRLHGPDSTLARAVGGGGKEKTSMLFYAVGVVASVLISAWLGFAMYVLVAVIWFIPDRRIARRLEPRPPHA